MPHLFPTSSSSLLRSCIAAFMAGVALLNAGCGLKAPLHLPEEREQEVPRTDDSSGKRRVTRPAPQTPKQDRIDASTSPETQAPTPPADPDPSATAPPPGT